MDGFFISKKNLEIGPMKPYVAINASAGSGKTYTLVQRVLMICLGNRQKDTIRQILALTFTNKAANEMKERILSWLKSFTEEGYENNSELLSIQKELAEQGKKFTIEQLHIQSKEVLDYILHHYSTLNIGTIDKFNARLVRSFSYELGLAQNFNLEIQSEPFLLEAVDKMLENIGEDGQISEAFLDFVNYNIDQEDRVNIPKTLFKTAKEFIKDKHYHRLEENKAFDWEAYEKAKVELRKEIHELKEQSRKIAQDSLELIKNNGLELEDFANGGSGIGGFFSKFIDFLIGKREKFPFPANEENFLNSITKGASTKSKNKEEIVFSILDVLVDNRQNIIKNYILGEKKEKILQALLPLKVNKEIQDQLQAIELENDLVLLSKFNVLINENLQNEPSAFIYEKVGTQFQHYFFDEFQDTSLLQWMNFLPLRDHNVSMENSSFTLVGDPKQSIYRFRGGNAEIMLDIINGKDPSPVAVHLETLKNNYRSAQNIVKFNNDLYRFYETKLNPEHAKLFGEYAQQEPISKISGRVKVQLLENDVKGVFYQEAAEKMRDDIQECLDNGFSFSDIALMCRGNKDILNFSKKLGGLKVTYKGEEMFVKTISEKGLTLDLSPTIRGLIQFLYWEVYPKNKRYLLRMMYELAEAGRVNMSDFSEEMKKILALESKKEIEAYLTTHYGLRLRQEDFPHLNLYNFIEYYIHEFSVLHKETDFLLNFLELLYNYSQNTGATLKDFLHFWEEEGKNVSVQASENIDAIQLMTIHKAKGLEFPVVLLPMENEHSDTKVEEWLLLDENSALKSVNITGFEKSLMNYDQEIADFNESNTYKNFIDRLCLQYVATTRPVEQMFLYLQKPTVESRTGNEKSSKIEIYDFVQSLNLNHLDSFEVFPAQNEDDFKKKSSSKENEYISQSISSLAQKHDKKANITIATPSKSYKTLNQKVRAGIFAHEILAEIYSEEDIEKVLRKYLLEGTITLEEKSEIEKTLHHVLAQYPQYFAKGLEVMNERELMIEGKLYRPDRVVKNNNEWYVIDFKTGNPSDKEKEKYQKQIDFYTLALEKFGMKMGGAALIYL